MSEEGQASGGFLSKVVRFVRNPTVDWSELDSLGDSRESQYSRQMLKEMIERKRRNDFVRKREFDQLRKLRRKGPAQAGDLAGTDMPSSFIDTGMEDAGGREETLRKIDVIEAQMSRQWWKGRGAAPAEGTTLRGGHAPSAPVSLAPAGAGPTTLPPMADAAAGEAPSGATQAFAPTEPLGLPQAPEAARAVRVPFQGDNAPGAPAWRSDAAATTAGPSPVQEKFVHEPDLEEAAILFANGDYAGAASGLMGVLARHANDGLEQQIDIWMTLFDLYRATGQQEPFDVLAIDYAARFGRTAPLWFSLPEQLGVAAAAADEGAAARELSWNAPATMGQQTVAALQAALQGAAPPWTLDWERLTAIEPSAVGALGKLFAQWADQAFELRFRGVAALQRVLQAHTVSGDRGADPQWWHVRMALLRLMGDADAFELVALDYCVTYEVSPPSWAAPRVNYRDDDAPGDEVLTVTGADLLTGEAELAPAHDGARVVAELSGHVEGDAGPLLQPMEALMRDGQPFTIACDRLIRIDFPAVGSVLNWAALQQARGQELHFHNLHRLVAVFFNVVGISEHAWVEPRTN